MPEISPAYLLAAHVHDTFFGRKNILSGEQITASGVIAIAGSKTSRSAHRIEVQGEIQDEQAKQTLSKDGKGNFHLSTKFEGTKGAHVQRNIRPNAPLDRIDDIFDSLFMRKLLNIALPPQE